MQFFREIPENYLIFNHTFGFSRWISPRRFGSVGYFTATPFEVITTIDPTSPLIPALPSSLRWHLDVIPGLMYIVRRNGAHSLGGGGNVFWIPVPDGSG